MGGGRGCDRSGIAASGGGSPVPKKRGVEVSEAPKRGTHSRWLAVTKCSSMSRQAVYDGLTAYVDSIAAVQ
jgi:hypothetical protein